MLPPFVAVAVKVVDAPLHMLVDGTEMTTDGVTADVILITIVLLVTVVVVMQGALLVIVQVI